MREIRALSGRALLALICSLLMVFQPIFAVPDPSATVGLNRGGQIQLCGAVALTRTVLAAMFVALPFVSHEGASNAPESIAVAKLTGTADRNGQPLLNGSIVSSGDSLRTHADSALLLSSTPQERLWLGPNTSAKLAKDAADVAVTLERGTLGFETRGHIQVTFEAQDGLMLRSRPGTPALAQLSFVNNQEAQVRVQKGSLELVRGDHSVVLQPERSISAASTRLPGDPPGKSNLPAQAESNSQSDMGSITVTVVDKQLFVVSGATVTLTNAAGRTFTVPSDQGGKYTFSNIPPGKYTLRVVRAGYQNYELPNVAVRAGNESSLYVELGGGAKKAGSNHLLVWVLVGGVAVGVVGIFLATKGSSSNSPSSTE